MLKLSTKSSLFKPLEVEVDGKTYYGAKFTAEVFEILKEKEPLANKGDLEALYAQVLAIYPDIPKKTLKQLDLRDLRTAVNDALDQMMNPVRLMPETEKKVGGPGQTAAPK